VVSLPSNALQRRHRSVEVVDFSLDVVDEGDEGRRLLHGPAGDVALVMWRPARPRMAARLSSLSGSHGYQIIITFWLPEYEVFLGTTTTRST